MSDTALEETVKTEFRAVEVARRQEADSWAMADAIHDDVVARVPALDRSRADGVKTGIKAVEEKVHKALEQDGHDYAPSYVHDLFVTRLAWPPEERVPQASFTAHYLLRSASYPNRRPNLERLLSKSKSGHVTAHQVRVWQSERKPKKHWTFLQLVDKRMRSSLKAAAKPWHTVSGNDRAEIARLLHRLAAEVEDGSFPKKAQ